MPSGHGLVILRRVDDAEALLAAVMAWGQQRSDVWAVLLLGPRPAPTPRLTSGRTLISPWW